jgi:hypothetical protein
MHANYCNLLPEKKVHIMRLDDTLFEVLKNQFILVLPCTRHITHPPLSCTTVPMVPALTH